MEKIHFDIDFHSRYINSFLFWECAESLQIQNGIKEKKGKKQSYYYYIMEIVFYFSKLLLLFSFEILWCEVIF